jgi:EAL domain-containing protein (putative c-di-GMP-specific phosphodiesterase class I)
VLDRALAQCASWRNEGAEVAVSVNISASNLIDAGFAGTVHDLLSRRGLPANVLVLEITETNIIAEFDRARIVVDELSALGVVVSIDDFGTGFTSLAYLSGLSVGELKLDQTFITRLGADGSARDEQLVRSTIDLGHALGMRVVAEGIEDRVTLDLLCRLGCDVAQGYFIGKPEAPTALPLQQSAALQIRKGPRNDPPRGRRAPRPASLQANELAPRA